MDDVAVYREQCIWSRFRKKTCGFFCVCICGVFLFCFVFLGECWRMEISKDLKVWSSEKDLWYENDTWNPRYDHLWREHRQKREAAQERLLPFRSWAKEVTKDNKKNGQWDKNKMRNLVLLEAIYVLLKLFWAWYAGESLYILHTLSPVPTRPSSIALSGKLLLFLQDLVQFLGSLLWLLTSCFHSTVSLTLF